MPTPNIISAPIRKAVYSVTEVATSLCSMSRARFYDLIKDGVLPHPVYCVRTKRPIYPADLAAICVRVKETNIGIDGRYVIFYARRSPQPAPVNARTRQPSRSMQRPDPLRADMVEALRAMGVVACEEQLTTAISGRCPDGLKEETFETDLRSIFDHLRCRNGV